MLKLFHHYLLAQAQFHKAGPDIEKALDPVLLFYDDQYFLYDDQQIDLKL